MLRAAHIAGVPKPWVIKLEMRSGKEKEMNNLQYDTEQASDPEHSIKQTFIVFLRGVKQ